MLKKVFFCFWFFLFMASLFLGVVFVGADELEDIQRQISEVNRLLEESRKATKPLEENLKKIETDLKNITDNIIVLEEQIVIKQREIELGENNLEKQQQIINEKARKYYKESRAYFNNVIGLFISKGLSEATRLFFYQQQSLQRDRELILKTALFIKSLEVKKNELQQEQKRLAAVKTELDKQKQFFQQEVSKAKNYQSGLERRIAELTAQQQQIINQRLAALNIPRSAGTSLGGCVDDRGVDPGFSPRFALFTYGVPNRTGLNQYGAKGRAEAGQGYEEILRAYYENFELKTDYNQTIQIVTDTGWSGSIEDYVKRIYEMPESWPIEALKAQAVAARSYALAYTNNGERPICTTQNCQVFKPEPKGGNWEVAVEATRGIVMVQGGSPIKAWYSSTHGGYVLPTSELPGWSATSWTKHAVDSSSGGYGGFSDLHSYAYDKDSPWFYCDWGYRSQYNNTAWLREEEIADIANAILLARCDSNTQEHLYQTDKPHPYGGEIWDESRVKQELRNCRLSPFDNVSSVSVDADFNSGRTTNVIVSGDGRSESFSGAEFKNFFNLRAPANIQIVGPLYNVEQR